MDISPMGPHPVTKNRLPRDRPGQYGVDGISQRIENGPIVLRNRRVELPDIRRWYLHEFRERPILIDTDNAQVLADMRLAQPALVAMPAVDVHFRADEIALLDGARLVSHALDDPQNS